ncbi:MAG: mechanosensitive ion channel family protein [Desulfocapsaceae bacterium]|nr:mechanosensitive ion channel family protein [Desulfocapsaceae bacterium]
MQRYWFLRYACSFLVLLFFPEHTVAAPAQSNQEKIPTWFDPLITLFTGNLWVKGAAVILLTFTIASLITWLLFKLLRWITGKSRFNLDESVIHLLRPPVYYSLLATGIYSGIEIMPMSEKITMILGQGIRTIGLIVWIIFLSRFATLFLKRLANISQAHAFIQNRTLTLFDNAAKILILGLGVYALFVIWNIDMTAWLASAGIAGLAIGFAAKDTIANLFAGVFILADSPYKVGDYIVLDQGERGKVKNIGLRSTRILTRDDVEITIPNSIIGNSSITNQSGGHHVKMRLRVKVGVAYGSDIDRVREILMESAREEKLVEKEPDPRVRFRAFGASSLDFELLCWINDPELRGQAVDVLLDRIYKRFNAEKIEIPYAKHDVYIKAFPGQLAEQDGNKD